MIKSSVSRMVLEKPDVEGDIPVDENRAACLCGIPSSSELVEFAVNLAGPPAKPEYYPMTDSGLVP